MTLTLTRHADVTALLADPRFDVPTAPPASHGLAWLRGAVSRFSRGDQHARRRSLAAALLTASPAQLRAEAAARAADPDATPRDVPVTVLAAALGARRPVHEQVAVVTPGYFGRVQTGLSEMDAAVDDLVTVFGGEPTERVAAAIGLLVQAHEATSELVTRALTVLGQPPAEAPAFQDRPAATPIEAVLAETLRHDPPVPAMRRECLVDHDHPYHGPIAAGTVVVLDLVAANRDPDVFTDPDRFDPSRPNLDQVLTFGSGPRACPGRDHALALALGAIEGVLRRG